MIDRTEPPYTIKLHLTVKDAKDIEVKQSILEFIQKKEFGYWTSSDIEIQIK